MKSKELSVSDVTSETIYKVFKNAESQSSTAERCDAVELEKQSSTSGESERPIHAMLNWHFYVPFLRTYYT